MYTRPPPPQKGHEPPAGAASPLNPAGSRQNLAQETTPQRDGVLSAVTGTTWPAAQAAGGGQSTYQGPGAALTLQGQPHRSLMAAPRSGRAGPTRPARRQQPSTARLRTAPKTTQPCGGDGVGATEPKSGCEPTAAPALRCAGARG